MTKTNTAKTTVTETATVETLDLTVDPSTYCPDWGWAEGLREVGQNLWDSERRGARAEVKWTAAHGSWTLDLTNHGAAMSRRALVMGGTDKRGDDSQVGYHGDGLKSGAMALLRAGCQVSVRTADERWDFATAWSEQFESQVLRVSITKLPEICAQVTVTVTGLPYEAQEHWDILFVPAPATDAEWLDQGLGVSRLYQGGVLIHSGLESSWGSLSLPNKRLKLDRDRNVVKSVDLHDAASVALWGRLKQLKAGGDDVGARLLRFIMTESNTLSPLDARVQMNTTTCALEFSADVARAFREQYGDDAVITDGVNEANQARHLGLTPVVGKDALYRFFCYASSVVSDSVLGSHRIRAALKAITAGSSVPDAMMSDRQRDAFQLMLRHGPALEDWCAAQIRKPKRDLPPLAIIATNSEASYYERDTGKLALALGHLNTVGDATATLCHELAHRWSDADDLTPAHTRMMERIFGLYVQMVS